MKPLMSLFAGVALLCTGAIVADAGTLDQVKARGSLICGANIGLSAVYFALEFPAARIVAVEVRSAPAARGHTGLRLEVHDTGVGVPAEARPRMTGARLRPSMPVGAAGAASKLGGYALRLSAWWSWSGW